MRHEYWDGHSLQHAAGDATKHKLAQAFFALIQVKATLLL
jgi:hypothetical protein